VFFAGLSSIWEVALICFGFACCFYHLGCFGRLSDDTSSSVSVVSDEGYITDDVAAVSLRNM
jgi:hypothetical protein